MPIDILWLVGFGVILIVLTLVGTATKGKRLRFLIVDLVMLFGVYIVAFQLPRVFSLEDNAVARVLLLILFAIVFKLIRLKAVKPKASSTAE